MKIVPTAIRAEVQGLIVAQIETFGRPGPLSRSQLHELRSRNKKIRLLCEQLDQTSSRLTAEQRLKKCS
jgi:hypothetical protein